ncbi:ubiquitin-conjugating enzyme E2 S [Basidiobolus ranarum]|uniref:Ubiquitin-conjugating enzyme E2 S n=1 Tax=Basidiobolus ranarum TaxID=34480 RepID=A0ABR2WPA5_9FUNG
MPVGQNHSPEAIKQIIRDLYFLHLNPIQDIRVIINENDLFDFQVWIYGPTGTPYENGAFRVKLMFTSEFPHTPPDCKFLTKIFHPNISPSGEVCVNTLRCDWHPSLGVRHILMMLRCLLIQPNPESALNEEAGNLLLENYEDYVQRARLITEIHAYYRIYQEEGKSPRKRSSEMKERRVDKKRNLKPF